MSDYLFDMGPSIGLGIDTAGAQLEDAFASLSADGGFDAVPAAAEEATASDALLQALAAEAAAEGAEAASALGALPEAFGAGTSRDHGRSGLPFGPDLGSELPDDLVAMSQLRSAFR